MAAEARTMGYLRGHGYPVPAVEDLSGDGTDMVMERIDGPSMVAFMSRRPWELRRQGAVLAALHRRLHEIPAPGFLPPAPVGSGDRFLHMDLHPLNVILSARGPVVIDWPNAARGDPLVDVGLAWVLMATGEVPSNQLIGAVLGWGRAALISGFLTGVGPDLDPVKERLRSVVEFKVRDPHMSATEQRAMWRMVERHGRPQ
jgi:aminoglycoside phosphotransferase (APT) family kinase protein